MPHAVFRPAPPLEEFWRAFEPAKEVRPDGTILEARASFLRADGGLLLVQCLAYELGPPQHFHIICDRRGDRVTIRCEQFSPVARTEGVIALVAAVARQYRDFGGTVEKTNLELDPDRPSPEGGTP